MEDKKDFWITFKGILSYVIIIVVVLLIKEFVITPIRVNGESMENTLKDKDIMLLDKISYYQKSNWFTW